MTTILGGVRLPSDLSSPRSGSRILNIRVRSDVMSATARGECAGGGTMLVGDESATERPAGRYCCRPSASHEIISGSSSLLYSRSTRSSAALRSRFGSRVLPIVRKPWPSRTIGEVLLSSSQLSIAARSYVSPSSAVTGSNITTLVLRVVCVRR